MGKSSSAVMAAPLSPSLAPRKAPRASLAASPSLSPSLSPLVATSSAGGADHGPDDGFVLDTGAGTGARRSTKRAAPTTTPAPAPPAVASATVPTRPPSPAYDQATGARALLSAAPSAAHWEEYSADEKQLNEFLKLHPMLSLEATSARTLQLVAGMFEKASIRTPELPVVPKSFDDQCMRPPNTRIGERACVCGESCICAFLAKLRFGPETEYAFVGTEFLLPAERERFLAGSGLPERRKKCLLCMRYFQHYNYLSARTNPEFRIGGPVQLQAFENAVLDAVEAPPNTGADEANEAARATHHDLPTHTSPVASSDGYLPSAMLFVDEQWMNTRAAREERLGALMWKPVVKFSSLHYRYRMDATTDTPYIVQVGVGADDAAPGGADFGVPPTATAAPSGAEPPRSSRAC